MEFDVSSLHPVHLENLGLILSYSLFNSAKTKHQ